jgi:hypothetical protein
VDSHWDLVEVNELSKDGLEAVLSNEIAGLRIPAFVDQGSCVRAAEAIHGHGFDYYEKLEPPLGRVGITQYERREDKPRYFEQGRQADAVRRSIFAGTGDPVALVVDALSQAWPRGAHVAEEPGFGSYFAGLIRITIGGIRIHCDWAPQDAPGWDIGSVTGQLAWNIYYDLTESGGQTTVYRQPWTPALQDYADPSAFGYYLPEAVERCPRQDVAPRRGEFVIFSSRNLHSVAAAAGTGARVSASSFVGQLPDGSLALWS